MENKIMDLLKKYTQHKNIVLTPRGNKAIYAALRIIKKIYPEGILLFPDQGGWITYYQYANRLRLNKRILKTNYGVIDLNNLKENIKQASALIYSNPAAYYAEQPAKEIYNICKRDNLIVILDISGCIGSDFYSGNYADITVCSFGKWKPVNLGYGGFISIINSALFDKDKNFLKNIKFGKKHYASLYDKLLNLKNRYEFFKRFNEKIKNDLKQPDILHKEKNGINVIIKFENEEQKNRIIDYCEKNKYEFVVCPNPIKVNVNAISIEVKRLE